jgi:BirA family biotin operon repressor/biotin-[acetyl-CoA-carboxylase] ligase
MQLKLEKLKLVPAVNRELNNKLKGPIWVLFLGEFSMNKLNLFNYDQIKLNLNNTLNGKTFLKTFDSIDSTNDQAKNYLKEIKEKNIRIYDKQIGVFAADFQEKGRGRRGHNWFSGGPAGISVSFLFEAGDNIAQIPLITAAAALAVNDNFKDFALKTKIKWPNDILIGNKKIAGILTELVFDETQSAFVIIGCGINLNNSAFNNKISDFATSYYLEKGEKINKNIFLAGLINKMQYYIEGYLYGNRNDIIKSWKKELGLTGKKIDFTYKNNNYTGVIKEILNNGDLLIELKNGKTKQLDSLNTSLNYKSLAKYNDFKQS